VAVAVAVAHNQGLGEFLALAVQVGVVQAMFLQQQLLVQLTREVVAVELMVEIWALAVLVLLLFPTRQQMLT
jgi:hypothetical protein